MELHSEKESFRKALPFRAPDSSAATLLVLRRSKDVWLTLNGAERTSVVMSDAEAADLIDAIHAARGKPK